MADDIEEGLVYDDNHMPGRPSQGMGGADIMKMDPNKHHATHLENYHLLKHFHQHGTTKEKIMAAGEMKIAERKMKFWSQHPNFDSKAAEQHNVKLKKQWAGGPTNEELELDEGSADAFLKFRAKVAAKTQSDEDRVKAYLSNGGHIKKADAKPMSNKLSASKNTVKQTDFDKELRQAANYLKPKQVKEAVNPNLAKILAMRSKAAVTVAGVQKAKKDSIVKTTSPKAAKEVETFLDKDGNRVKKIATGKRNYSWPQGNPVRKPRKGIKEDIENIDETSHSKIIRYMKAAHADQQSMKNPQSFPGAADGTGKTVNPENQQKYNRRSKGLNRAVNKYMSNYDKGIREEEQYPQIKGAKPLSKIIAQPAKKYNEYTGSTADERAIMKRYQDHTVLVPDRNGNGDDVFKAAKIKRAHKPLNPGDDEKIYAAWNGDVPVVEEVDYTQPTPHIPFEDRDGDNHIVVAHSHFGQQETHRNFLGNGVEKGDRPKLHSHYEGGERKAKVFSSHEEARDHVSKILEKPRDYSHKELSFSIHPKRTEEAISAEEAAASRISDQASAKFKTKDKKDFADGLAIANIGRNAVHPAMRMNGSSQGMWLHHHSDFNHYRKT